MTERLAFMASWLDQVSGVSWTYQLMFFPATGEVEMVRFYGTARGVVGAFPALY